MHNNDKVKLIEKLPKAELHLHIEGTFEPELMFEIAKRNKIKIKYKSVEELKSAYNFNNLQSFLDIYYAGADVLIHEKDFYDLTISYLKKCKQDNVVHTEIFFDPQTHLVRGVEFEVFFRGIHSALTEGQKNLGISFRMIPCFLRHLSEQDAISTFEQSIPYLEYFEAFGLDSSEWGHPPSKFQNVFSMVRSHGLKVVAHAGEEGPADYILQALDLLQACRIDHGVRCDEDSQLMKRLKNEQVPLTVCPLSNLKLKVVIDLKKHNLKKLLDYGLNVTINSDDPAYFGGYLNENFIQVMSSLDLSDKDIKKLCKNSFHASFLSEHEINKWIQLIES